MADELKDIRHIRVHQALHGYSDGHRLLASSTTLKPKEQKTMLIMSDVSGSGAVIGKAGYLTGYPLPESGFYALARTWPATELPRPGCVWTHTLLLDFSDLALLPTMEALVLAFRRPQGTQPQIGYDKPVTLEDTQPHSTFRVDKDEHRESFRHLLWALYERPKERIVVDESSASEHLVLALWSQQWPRLRRAFRFCTLTFGDRSVEGSSFDLQFLPPREASVRSRFSTATDASRLRAAPAQWLEDALLDLSEGVTGRLRAFLRQAGGDVAGGREAFVPLCRLHKSLNDFDSKPDAVDAAVTLLEEAFDTESAKSARTIVTSTAATRADTLSDRSLAFVMQHLDLLGADQLAASERLGAELWSRNPDLLIGLLESEPPRRGIADRLLAKMSTSDLAKSLHRVSTVNQQVLACRPDLVTEPEFWTLDKAWQIQGILVAAAEPERSQAAVAAMLAANRTDLAAPAVRAFGSTQLLRAIDLWLSEKGADNPTPAISSWLDAALTDAALLAKALSNQIVQHNATLIAIARRTDPDFVPNEVGEDPWWTAVRESKGELSDRGLQYLSAHLIARALGHRSRNTAELLAFALDPVYSVALRSQLADEAWRLMEARLPWSMWWFDWDRCRRMRAAIVDTFVDRDLSPATFGQITSSDDLFAQLAELAAYNKRGRRFLRRVRDALKEVSSERFRQRVSILQDLI